METVGLHVVSLASVLKKLHATLMELTAASVCIKTIRMNAIGTTAFASDAFRQIGTL